MTKLPLLALSIFATSLLAGCGHYGTLKLPVIDGWWADQNGQLVRIVQDGGRFTATKADAAGTLASSSDSGALKPFGVIELTVGGKNWDGRIDAGKGVIRWPGKVTWTRHAAPGTNP